MLDAILEDNRHRLFISTVMVMEEMERKVISIDNHFQRRLP